MLAVAIVVLLGLCCRRGAWVSEIVWPNCRLPGLIILLRAVHDDLELYPTLYEQIIYDVVIQVCHCLANLDR